MPQSLGTTTQTLFEIIENHKLHLEFAAGGTINAGQLVKMGTAGAIVVAANNEPAVNVIGVAIHSAVSGEMVTVAMKGYALVIGNAPAAITNGPVKVAAYHTAGKRPGFAAMAATEDLLVVGTAINTTVGSDQTVKVVLN